MLNVRRRVSLCYVTALFLSVNAFSQEANTDLNSKPATTAPSVSDHIEKDWLINRHKQVSAELSKADTLSKINVVFIGDSITEGWLTSGYKFWNDSFSGKPWQVLNLGVSGDKTQNILHRLMSHKDGGMGNLDSAEINPDIIVLMIGTNNLWNDRPDEILKGVVACKNRIQELEPQARMIVCSVLPVSDSKITREVVVPLNADIESLHNPSEVTWLNLYPHFTKEDGSLREELFTDGVHLTPKGYEVWHDLMVPVMQEVLKSSMAE